MVFLQATPDAIISPRALILNDFLAFVQIATWRYVTTNQGTRSRSRFRPARPLAPSSRAPAPSVALPQPRHFAAFRACRKSAWLDKGDRHQRPAKRLLRSPATSRTAISGARCPTHLCNPGGILPVHSQPSARRLPRTRPVVRPFQRPRLRSATAPATLVPRYRLARRGFARKEILYRPRKNRPKAARVHSQFINYKFTSLPKSHPFRGQWSSRPR